MSDTLHIQNVKTEPAGEMLIVFVGSHQMRDYVADMDGLMSAENDPANFPCYNGGDR